MRHLMLQSEYEDIMKKMAIITDDELRLVKEMAAGKSASDIAREWGRSFYTIKTRMYTLRVKTGYRKNTLLVAAFKDAKFI